MSFSLIENALRQRFLCLSLNYFTPQTCNLMTILRKPRLRHPNWHLHKQRVVHEDNITPDNREFIKEVIKDRYSVASSMQNLQSSSSDSPLASQPESRAVWAEGLRRCGLIARKIGDYPLWDTKGERVLTTLLQVVDNHVIKYTPPSKYESTREPVKRIHKKLGCLIVGSETVDPSTLTKEYYGIFEKAGVLPKKNIFRFFIHPRAALAPGTPLLVSHFRVGDAIDVRGLTIDRGFQGVVKRWGFKGMPASHGVTKTHRRPGNIGGGGEKARVWPGKKMPGHMGNRWRISKGATVLRINTKYNVLWVKGVAIPGGVNSLCYLYDTILPLRQHKTAPPFPTYYKTGEEEEEIFHESIHHFKNPTITFTE